MIDLQALAQRAHDAQLSAMDDIEAAAQAAFNALWQYLTDHPDVPPRDAILAIQSGFTGDAAEALAAAFSTLLAASVGPASVEAMPVGDVTLSARNYAHNVTTANQVTAIVRDHAKGVAQARDLAMSLYDGYDPKDGIIRPLEGSARGELPDYLRQLTMDPEARQSLAKIVERGQEQVSRMRSGALRAAYQESLDTWAKGGAENALKRKLEVAVLEKNRYFANRIAQTELARAHQTKVARQIMADEALEVVQVVMNPRHPRTDICDYWANADLHGLGPGCYPKAEAPRPPYHPYCWCSLALRPSLRLSDAGIRQTTAGYLRSMPEEDAARVVGSKDRLARVLNGDDIEDVIDAGKPDAYRTTRVGDAARQSAMP